MKLHIGTKLVKSKPMNRADYNVYRGWQLPGDEGGEDEGYLVEYTDGGKPNHEGHGGYISWSPKEQFGNAYQDVNVGVSFGHAVQLARLGNKVARTGWNGSEMFAYIVPANKYSTDGNPNSPVKGLFPDDMVPYREYWALKTAQNDVATWSPSGSDSLANDWVIVEANDCVIIEADDWVIVE